MLKNHPLINMVDYKHYKASLTNLKHITHIASSSNRPFTNEQIILFHNKLIKHTDLNSFIILRYHSANSFKQCFTMEIEDNEVHKLDIISSQRKELFKQFDLVSNNQNIRYDGLFIQFSSEDEMILANILGIKSILN